MEDVPRQKEGRFLVFGMSSFINFPRAAAFHFANVGKMIFTFQILVKSFREESKTPFCVQKLKRVRNEKFFVPPRVDHHQYFRSKDFLLSLVRAFPSFRIIVET